MIREFINGVYIENCGVFRLEFNLKIYYFMNENINWYKYCIRSYTYKEKEEKN